MTRPAAEYWPHVDRVIIIGKNRTYDSFSVEEANDLLGDLSIAVREANTSENAYNEANYPRPVQEWCPNCAAQMIEEGPDTSVACPECRACVSWPDCETCGPHRRSGVSPT